MQRILFYQFCLIAVLLCSVVFESSGQQVSRKGAKAQRRAEPSQSENRIAALLQAGRLEEAEKLAREAVAKTPRDSQAHALLGVILDQRGQQHEAEKELREAVRLNPNSAGALTNLAVLLTRTQRPDEALTTFKRVLRIDPDHAQSNYNLALLHISRKEYKPAIPLLERLVKLSGGIEQSEIAFLLTLADAYAHGNRLEDAASISAVIERRANTDPPVLFTTDMEQGQIVI